MPKISVVIPAYNRVKYLPEAITSVLNQTYKDFEVIIIDDGSTDNTKEIVDSYAKDYPDRLKYFYQKNSGPAAARNLGIKNATGGYIAFLDSDDLWFNYTLDLEYSYLTKNGFDWICCSYKRMILTNTESDSGDYHLNRKFLDVKTNQIRLINDGIFSFTSLGICPGTVLAKKHCFEIAGLFDESFFNGEDIDLWMRFEESGLKGGYLDIPTFIYRINSSGITKSSKICGVSEHLRLAKKHLKLIKIDPLKLKKSYSDFLWQYGIFSVHAKKYRLALFCFARCFLVYFDLKKVKKIFNFMGNSLRHIWLKSAL